MFEYINENVEKVRDPENVMMIKTIKGNVSSYLGAYLKDGELIRLTKSKNFMTYPFEPIHWFSREVAGSFYFDGFSTIMDHVSINKQYLESFVYCDSFDSKKRYDLFVTFTNGIIVRIACTEKKYFENKLKSELKLKFNVKIERRESGITID